MGIFSTLASFFKAKNAKSDQAWRDGYEAFKEGSRLYLERNLQEALVQFDRAIQFGFVDADVYAERGSCLQLLNFDLEAIEDFDAAIDFEPTDSNLYFMRATSKGSIGDLHGCESDLQEAIRVAGIDNATNRSHNNHAQKQGYEDISSYYRMRLLGAEMDLEDQAADEIRLKGPGASLGPDLSSRRRAKARRRGYGA